MTALPIPPGFLGILNDVQFKGYTETVINSVGGAGSTGPTGPNGLIVGQVRMD